MEAVAVIWHSTTGGAVTLLSLLVNDPLFPVKTIVDVLAVAIVTVLVTSDDVLVASVPAVMRVLHEAVALRCPADRRR